RYHLPHHGHRDGGSETDRRHGHRPQQRSPEGLDGGAVMRARNQGITVIEVLIAAAIVGVVLAITLRLYGGTVRAYRVNEEVAETRQGIQAAISLLQYEIGLAGYRCTDGSALTRTFGSSPLIAVDGSSGASDSITVRYYEDRYVAGSCELTQVTYY